MKGRCVYQPEQCQAVVIPLFSLQSERNKNPATFRSIEGSKGDASRICNLSNSSCRIHVYQTGSVRALTWVKDEFADDTLSSFV